jgi:hypothetical protein
VAKFHEMVGTDEMVGHEFLTDNYLVEKTTFSSGVSIIVNLGHVAYRGDGFTVPGRGWRVTDKDGKTQVQRFATQVVADVN